ncbi:DUF956 family protein [Lacticaseibacillus pantheris]|jgi:hypothetical protein|uniref:DUF956 family protein n=1 Tax=Lacticaseibacillus pantheris DSM 15945 = JCM 12539 = NBRC 106106 TaxID=1423783 RepID=A0A0R1U5S1_9LACO|nr:DUF956 family protein [Lacticaseibacillus pantheris]KRL86659.1 hypothetical protein FC50_GL000623 [Lacticaseibacillus pantheris DSM 15945 = JCM 12539 = NBRC 106106]WKF84077.1 DUF956 family protein [Lacticaseibacillus pantheris]
MVEVEILNHTAEGTFKVNSMVSASDPKPGFLILGDGGLEFRADSGRGFIMIPWANVKRVRAQVYMKTHVRGFFIDVDDGRSFNFVASQAVPALRIMRDHLGSDKLVKAATLTGTMGKRARGLWQNVTKRFSRKSSK